MARRLASAKRRSDAPWPIIPRGPSSPCGHGRDWCTPSADGVRRQPLGVARSALSSHQKGVYSYSNMASFGYTLLCEQRAPGDLVREGRAAEAGGFDFAVITDHFHPWLDVQGHSPFAWSVLGALAEVTERMGLMTMVTCPTTRYHPAIVAQMAATMAVMSRGRFQLGVGAGEKLN